MTVREPSDSASTKERLLETGERLFAERGFEGTSIRDLATEAGVNIAAINYHFQGKENLYLAVIAHRMKPLRQKVEAALRTVVDESEGPPPLESVVRAFVTEVVRGLFLEAGGMSYLSLMAREWSHPHRGFGEIMREFILPTHEAFRGAVCAAHHNISRTQCSWILASVIGQVLHFVLRRHIKECRAKSPELESAVGYVFPPMNLPLEEYVTEVIDHISRFSIGGIERILFDQGEGARELG